MEFQSIAQSIYLWLESNLFGEVLTNAWYTQNRDTILGIALVVVCTIVFVLALVLVIAVARFLGRCVDFRG